MNIKKRISLNMLKSSDGTIEDFLPKERGYRDIHFHETMNLPVFIKKIWKKCINK
jgi:hypothetical protein